MGAKLYLSKVWLRRQFLVLRKSPELIAEEQNVSKMTIYRKLREFKLIK